MTEQETVPVADVIEYRDMCWKKLNDLKALEVLLDEKHARDTTWSARWWHRLGEINIVRGQVCWLRRELYLVNGELVRRGVRM